MKKSMTTCRSYCQLLKQWSRLSAQCCACKPAVCCSTGPNRSWPTFTQPQNIRLCSSEAGVADAVEKTGVTTNFPVLEKINIEATFRTKENDPTKHTVDHEGLYFRVPVEMYEDYIKHGQYVEYKKQVKTFQECTLMVRRPALEAFEVIDSANYEYPPLKLLFYGKNGAGKTMSLAHTVYRYSQLGWLIIHLPDMLNTLRIHQTRPTLAVVSTYNPSRYDYTNISAQWLAFFKHQNLDHLKSLKTTKDYVWSQREKTVAGTELVSMIDFGISRKRFASDVIGALLKEIKKKASEKQFKVMVAVEGVNGFWKDTNVISTDKERINAQQVSFYQHFQKLFKPDWNNGVCVGTVCACVHALDTKIDRDSVPYTPAYLLGKQGFEFFDPFVPILVPEYSIKEARNCIDYFIERKWIAKPRSHTEEGKKELMLISNKNPYQLMTTSTHW